MSKKQAMMRKHQNGFGKVAAKMRSKRAIVVSLAAVAASGAIGAVAAVASNSYSSVAVSARAVDRADAAGALASHAKASGTVSWGGGASNLNTGAAAPQPQGSSGSQDIDFGLNTDDFDISRVATEQRRVDALISAGISVKTTNVEAATDVVLTSSTIARITLGIVDADLDVAKFVYTYSHGAMTEDGVLKVAIRVALKSNPKIVGTPTGIDVMVSGIDQAVVNVEQNVINKLVSDGVTVDHDLSAVTDALVPDAAFLATNFGIKAAKLDTSKFTYTFSHVALTVSASLPLDIKVALKARPNVAGTPKPITVSVTINKSKTDNSGGANTSGKDDSDGPNIGLIVGASVGGVATFVVPPLTIWLIKKNWPSIRA